MIPFETSQSANISPMILKDIGKRYHDLLRIFGDENTDDIQ